ncbi:MAG: hypothetical protein LBS56_05885 [Propionibacteriaceae bacterium]|jgi:hypothetical protein|nr:hypothetical protein [Propionibacteriaceae bacterium]
MAEHGRQPWNRTILRFRQQATLSTRHEKVLRSLADLTAEWRERGTDLLDEDATDWTRQVIASGEAMSIRADDVPLDMIEDLGVTVVHRTAERHSTWTRWMLHAEASRQTMGWRFATIEDRRAITGMIADAAQAASLRLTPEELSVPAEFTNPDGSSRFRPRHLALYSSQELLDAETALLHLSDDTSGPTDARVLRRL